MTFRSATVTGLIVAALGCSSSSSSPPAPPPPAPPTAGPVVPQKGLIAREVDVSLTAQGSAFDATTTVDFGPNIAVSRVVVVSPTAINAHLAVDKDADVGPRDVVIHDGVNAIVAHQAFTIVPDIDVTITSGAATSAGIVQFDVKNNDTIAFDVGAFDVIAPDLGVATWEGQTASNLGHGILFVDVFAPAAGGRVIALNRVASTVAPTATFYSAKTVLPVAARAPTVVTPGVALAAESFATPAATGLYKLTLAAPDARIVECTVTGTGEQTKALGIRLQAIPASGKFSERTDESERAAGPTAAHLVFPSPPAPAAKDAYFVASELAYRGGAASLFGYSFTVDVHVASTVIEQAGAHDTEATAQDLGTLPDIGASPVGPLVVGASGVAGETDVYKFTYAGTDRVELSRSPHAGADIIRPPPNGGGDEAIGMSTIRLYPGPAGTYYVKVQYAQTAAEPATTGPYAFSLRKVK